MRRYVYKATLVRVIDGDTIVVRLHASHDAGFGVELQAEIEQTIRLHGLNAPETHNVKHGSPEHTRGMAATNFVMDWFSKAQFDRVQLWVETIKDRQGKFGRYLGIVWAGDIDGSHELTLNRALIAAGHAVAKEY